MCAVMVISIGILLTSFNSYASAVGTNFGIEYFVNHPEPTIGDNAGYITMLCRFRSTGEKSIQTFFWTSYAFNSVGEELKHTIDLTVTNDYLKFGLSAPSTVTSARYTVNNYNQTGRFHQVAQFSGAWEWRDSDWDILAYKVSGNAHIISSSIVNENNPFTVFFSTDGSSILLMDVISLLQSNNSIDSSIMNTVSGILNSVDGVENQLSSVISYLQSVDSKLSSISSQLQQIYNKADEILNEQKKSNTWLGKIWDSIQEFINPKSEDSSKTDEFQDSSNAQKNEINDLNEQNQVDKVDVDSASEQIDSNINYDNMSEYGGVLASVTNNSYVLQMILVVVSIAIIAYVLFGKR